MKAATLCNLMFCAQFHLCIYISGQHSGMSFYLFILFFQKKKLIFTYLFDQKYSKAVIWIIITNYKAVFYLIHLKKVFFPVIAMLNF